MQDKKDSSKEWNKVAENPLMKKILLKSMLAVERAKKQERKKEK